MTFIIANLRQDDHGVWHALVNGQTVDRKHGSWRRTVVGDRNAYDVPRGVAAELQKRVHAMERRAA